MTSDRRIQMREIYPFLAEKTLRVIEGTAEERINFLDEKHWVGYPKAAEIHSAMLQSLNVPSGDRAHSRLIVSESYNGKTWVLEHFFKLIRRDSNIKADALGGVVLYVIAPPVADERRLLREIILSTRSPQYAQGTAFDMWGQLESLFKSLNIRMIIIDECQRILAGTTVQHIVCQEVIKHIDNKFHIPMFLAGMPSSLAAVSFDPQIENRFLPIALPLWAMDANYYNLLTALEKFIPLRKQSKISENMAMLSKIHDLSGGKIGETYQLLKLMTIHELKRRREIIDEESLQAVQADSFLMRSSLLHDSIQRPNIRV